MSSRSLVRPLFPDPPAEYNQQYQFELVRAFSVLLQQLQNPGDARHTTVTLTGLPTNDQGLEEGALFEVDGFVKISRSFNPHLAGASGTGAVGSVTVTTT
tara:strand:- start:8345 stop:8644 length:300 start_codon:yes stop_codon:yes gene_type:complete